MRPSDVHPARPAPAPPLSPGEVPALRRGRLTPLPLAQILVAEIAVLAVVAGFTRGLVPTLIAAALAVLALPVLFARSHGRWWLEHRLIARHHRRRRAAHPEHEAGPLLAGLRTIAPGLTVRDIAGPANGTAVNGHTTRTGAVPGAPVGVARDEAGWFSIIALAPGTAPLPLDVLTGLLTGADHPGVVLQLVTQTVPAPSPDVHPASPAAASYRQLMESPTPAHQESAISVRIDARTLAEALLDPAADAEAAAIRTAGLARRIVTALRRIGVTARALPAGELLTTLARHCDIEPGVTPDETWTHWRSTHLLHRTYWLKTWPDRPTELFGWAATAPVAHTTVALLVKTGEQGIAVRALLHLATRPEADAAALDRMLRDGAHGLGAELQPLDGEQGPARFATAPTGGGAG